MAKYDTVAGQVTPSNEFAQLIEKLRQCEEHAYMLGHLYKMQGDWHRGQGFLAVGEMFKMTVVNVTNLATGKLRKEGGFR